MKIRNLEVGRFMLDKTQERSNQTTQLAPVMNNAAIGRSRLKQAFDSGPKAIVNQIRYVFMLSQIVGKKSFTTIVPQKPLNVQQVRLQTLVNLADSLTDEQLERLYSDIQAVRNTSVRLSLLLQIAPKLSQGFEIISEVWKQRDTIADLVAEARILFQLARLVPNVEQIAETPSILAQIVEVVLHLNHMKARVKGLIALQRFLPDELFETYLRNMLNEFHEAQNDELCSTLLWTLAEYLPESLAEEALGLVDRMRSASYKAHALTALARYLHVDAHRHLHEKALKTIEIIEDESERAEAVIAFASYLESAEEDQEYPKLLEESLRIAITIASPQNRARVLVALAPHLTDDLQLEALAAVQGLGSERKQAQSLSELIPTLSSEMLLNSLTIANSMGEQEYRSQVLTILVQFVPQHVRQQTMIDALSAASNLPNQYEQVRALLNLRAWLPDSLQQEVVHRALITIEAMDNDNAKARALNLLLGHLSPAQIMDALGLVSEISEAQIYLNAILGFMPYVSSEQQDILLKEMLDCIGRIHPSYKRAQALINLAPYLASEQLSDAWKMAENINDAVDQINAYVSLAQQMPSDDASLLLDKALIRLKRITDGYRRANAMMTMMPHLNADARTRLKAEVYQTIERADDAYAKASVIELLAPLLESETLQSASTLPDILTTLRKGFDCAMRVPEQKIRADLLGEGALLWVQFSDEDASYELWKMLAHSLISLPLADVLLCLEAIRPILQQFVGKDYIKAIAYILGMR
jgi:Mor family transcriptional regulator